MKRSNGLRVAWTVGAITLATFGTLGTLQAFQSTPATTGTTTTQAPPGTQAGRTQAPLDRGSRVLLGSTTLYVLGDASELVQGCYLPCACPLSLAPEFRGTFALARVISPDPAFEAYRIDDVNWLASLSNDLHITGSGDYRVSTSGNVQELVLDLRIDSGPLTRYDSGLVPGGNGGRTPTLDLSINANDLVCFDTVLSIDARPATQSAVSYGIGEGSLAAEGCFDPCSCPVSLQPLRGTYGLLPLGTVAGFDEFAVLNMELGVGAFVDLDPLPTTPIAHGAGIYRLATDGSGTQQMVLGLGVLGSGATRFDSGLVPGGGLPVIEISVARNGFYCLDQVFGLVSAPR
jgi:hypothetical protein